MAFIYKKGKDNKCEDSRNRCPLILRKIWRKRIINTGVTIERVLLNVNEFCEYLSIGQTKARELMTKTNNPYTVRIGNRLYANKILLDKWIDSISGNKLKK